MDEILSNLANKIAEISNKRKALANAIDKGIKIKHKIDDIDLGNLKICGIDGGFFGDSIMEQLLFDHATRLQCQQRAHLSLSDPREVPHTERSKDALSSQCP